MPSIVGGCCTIQSASHGVLGLEVGKPARHLATHPYNLSCASPVSVTRGRVLPWLGCWECVLGREIELKCEGHLRGEVEWDGHSREKKQPYKGPETEGQDGTGLPHIKSGNRYWSSGIAASSLGCEPLPLECVQRAPAQESLPYEARVLCAVCGAAPVSFSCTWSFSRKPFMEGISTQDRFPS